MRMNYMNNKRFPSVVLEVLNVWRIAFDVEHAIFHVAHLLNLKTRKKQAHAQPDKQEMPAKLSVGRTTCNPPIRTIVFIVIHISIPKLIL